MWLARGELIHVTHVIRKCAHRFDANPGNQNHRGDYSCRREFARFEHQELISCGAGEEGVEDYEAADPSYMAVAAAVPTTPVTVTSGPLPTTTIAPSAATTTSWGAAVPPANGTPAAPSDSSAATTAQRWVLAVILLVFGGAAIAETARRRRLR